MDSANHFTVVIVGTGIAGCAAAKTLVENGIDDVIVLEATDRIGGRVKTVSYGGSKIDLGAQWIHGTTDNPLYDELNAKGLLTYNGETLYGHEGMANLYQFYDGNGVRSDKSLVGKGLRVSAMLDQRIVNAWDPSTDIELFKSQQFDQICKEENISEDEKSVCKQLLVWIDYYNQRVEAITKWDRRQLTFPDEFECDNKNSTVPSGMSAIFDHLLLPVMRDKICLNQEVELVTWSESGVSVSVKGGNEYTADHVIVTSSLGYLKDNKERMFSPRLPADKCQAIDRIWMGTSEKFILCYEEPFWPTDGTFVGFAFLRGKESCERLSKEMNELLEVKADWWRELITLRCVGRTFNALQFWLSNGYAKQASKCSDEEIIAVVLRLLKVHTGITAPSPSRLIRTGWGDDRYSNGSYSSNLTREYSPELARAMLEPVYCHGNPAILFAGEAWHCKWISTLQGAYDTGVQQANVICHHIRT